MSKWVLMSNQLSLGTKWDCSQHYSKSEKKKSLFEKWEKEIWNSTKKFLNSKKNFDGWNGIL